MQFLMRISPHPVLPSTWMLLSSISNKHFLKSPVGQTPIVFTSAHEKFQCNCSILMHNITQTFICTVGGLPSSLFASHRLVPAEQFLKCFTENVATTKMQSSVLWGGDILQQSESTGVLIGDGNCLATSSKLPDEE